MNGDRPILEPIEPTPGGRAALVVGAASGHRGAPARSFWADAWARVLRRPSAVAALAWISFVALLALCAPLVANGSPLLWEELAPDGSVRRVSSPLLLNLGVGDVLALAGAIVGAVLLLAPIRTPRPRRAAWLAAMGVQAGATVVLSQALSQALAQALGGPSAGHSAVAGMPTAWMVVASAVAALSIWLAPQRRLWSRVVVAAAVMLCCLAALRAFGGPRPAIDYTRAEAAGRARAVYTLIPWSPDAVRDEEYTSLFFVEPMRVVKEHLAERGVDTHRSSAFGERVLVLGTDGRGRDVLSEMIHACRLSISIGLVSTGIAVLIGVALGAIMGYFGGWVDLALSRVVEVFMAVPLLFLLIVCAGVLPAELRSTYVMMAIIGAVTWTGPARFTRAEFLKLRDQDFVKAAECVGASTRAILFRHMLPNGVTPVLVEASFGVAAAILAEATLSFLGLGPFNQPSWGGLLASSTQADGRFAWWLAVFPGLAIFLTVLSYNLLGEALRDAIDPKLRKPTH